ncbi:MAG TPA: hypothetical protein K8W19_10655, partial [Victivallis vadensis]|nr:hypothetical protein [Victivallis vadensis]
LKNMQNPICEAFKNNRRRSKLFFTRSLSNTPAELQVLNCGSNKYQQMIYDADEDLYEIIINTSGLLIEIKDIFIYVEQKKGIIPYHCIYLVHRFGGAKQSACLIFDKRQLK